MSGLKDLTGQRFGRLTVIRRVEDYISPKGQRKPRWLCLCDCSKNVTVDGCHLRNGAIQSCGCYNDALKRSRAKHGLRKKRLYNIWCGIKSRCYYEKNNRYSSYGGRGIKMCDEWKNDFSLFANWALKNGYNDTLSIDRIDVNGDYEPNNCRWATNKVQSENRTDNIICEINGKSAALSYWCDFYNKKYVTVYSRLKSGWTIEEALELVPRKK